MRAEKLCPHCSETIHADADVCKHCRRRVHPNPFVLPLILIALAAAGAFFWGELRDRPDAPKEREAFRVLPTPVAVDEAVEDVQPPMEFEQAQKAILRIETSSGSGTGFLVSSSGQAITSNHVVDKDKKVVVLLADGTSADATVTRRYLDGDLALLQIQAERDFPFLELEDATSLKSAQMVTVVGFPLGLETAVVTRGIVSAAPLYLPGLSTPLIQIDASVNPGNSGGPLLNESNRVVGVIAAKLFGAESMNWVVPINFATHLRVASAKGLDSGSFREWVSKGVTKVTDGGRDPSRSPEQVFSSWGEAESIHVQWVSKEADGLLVFLTLHDEADDPMATSTNIGITVKWTSGSCLGMKDVEPSDFGEQNLKLARSRGYQGDLDAMTVVRVPCAKLPAGERVDIAADFRESDIADYYSIQIN